MFPALESRESLALSLGAATSEEVLHRAVEVTESFLRGTLADPVEPREMGLLQTVAFSVEINGGWIFPTSLTFLLLTL